MGTGDGLIAFGALERLGPSGQAIFSDISQDLLDHCRAAASAEGLLDRCRFVLAPADQLTAVPGASVDAVTTRSVLIYVKDKARAMREFFRVLRPGGRASLFEPVNVLMSAADPDLFHGYDVTPVKALAARVQALYASIQPPGTDPDGRLRRPGPGAPRPRRRVQRDQPGIAGQREESQGPRARERFLRMSGNPLQPTFQEVLQQVLSAQEAGELTRHLRPLVESGTGLERTALAYLTTVKG